MGLSGSLTAKRVGKQCLYQVNHRLRLQPLTELKKNVTSAHTRGTWTMIWNAYTLPLWFHRQRVTG